MTNQSIRHPVVRVSRILLVIKDLPVVIRGRRLLLEAHLRGILSKKRVLSSPALLSFSILAAILLFPVNDVLLLLLMKLADYRNWVVLFHKVLVCQPRCERVSPLLTCTLATPPHT